MAIYCAIEELGIKLIDSCFCIMGPNHTVCMDVAVEVTLCALKRIAVEAHSFAQ